MRTTDRLDNRVFSLASNLFGYGAIENKQTPVHNPKEGKRIRAVYPAIVEESFSKTMDNYRLFVAKKNALYLEANHEIEKWNKAVRKFRKENKGKLSEVQLEFSKLFIKKHKSLSPLQYNQKAEDFSKEYGMIVQKRKQETIKPTTELVFQNFLCLYNQQLMTRNKRYMGCGIITESPLEAFKINAYKVTKLKRNGVTSLDLCRKTILNHRKRLEEFEVLTEYHFAGANRAVEVYINPEILVVTDLQTSKLISVENESVTSKNGKIVPNDNEKTGTIKKEEKMNGNVNNSQKIRSSGKALTGLQFFLTGTHTTKEDSFKPGVAPNPTDSRKTPSERLLSLILHPQELAQRLADGEYHNYTPIDIRVLFTEAFRGTLTNDEYRELVIQDFFKSLSGLYRHSSPFEGSYKKAINLYYQYKWLNFSGNSFNKSVLIDEVQQMRWRIEWARKWFTKNEFKPLFPYDYLDNTRKTAKEVGFEYTKIKWNEHLQAMKKYEALKKKQQANAIRRKESINYNKKLDNALNRFFKDKMTCTQLFDYAQKNLPTEFSQKLPELILKRQLKMNEKAIIAPMVQYNLYET